MGGEDLLEQRGSRAGQADDEYRILAGKTVAPARLEELPGADCGLQFRVAQDGLQLESDVGFLQRIAGPVVLEGFGELLPVLERLAQREAQVIAIDAADDGSLHLGTHPRELLVREAVGLEIRKAPIGVAEA